MTTKTKIEITVEWAVKVGYGLKADGWTEWTDGCQAAPQILSCNKFLCEPETVQELHNILQPSSDHYLLFSPRKLNFLFCSLQFLEVSPWPDHRYQ